ncbi:MAG: hypothetical protein ACYC3L_13505 [Gemmatimonadaceae bacterium]
MLKRVSLSSRVLAQLDNGLRPLLAHRLTGARIERAHKGSAPTHYSIGDSLELWYVDAAAVADLPSGADLRVVARQSARLHHQLLIGTVDGCVQSVAAGTGRRVESFSLSLLASAVATGVARLDAVIRQRGRVRVLAIPSARLTTLWVVPDDARRASRVLVIEAPKALRLGRRTLISSSSLLRVVQRAHERALLATHPHPREV